MTGLLKLAVKSILTKVDKADIQGLAADLGQESVARSCHQMKTNKRQEKKY